MSRMPVFIETVPPKIHYKRRKKSNQQSRSRHGVPSIDCTEKRVHSLAGPWKLHVGGTNQFCLDGIKVYKTCDPDSLIEVDSKGGVVAISLREQPDPVRGG